jgi:hypothetical protein
MTTLPQLKTERDRLMDAHWRGQENYTRDEIWTLMELIVVLEEQVKALMEEQSRIEETTLGGVLNKMKRENNGNL